MILIKIYFYFVKLFTHLPPTTETSIYTAAEDKEEDSDPDDDSYEPDSESGNEESSSDLSDFLDETSFAKGSDTNPLPTFISEGFSEMSIDNNAFSVDFKCPFMQYGYIEQNQSYCEVDMLVLTLSSKYFRPKMQTGGLNLEVGIMVPSILLDKRRLMLLKAKDRNFIDDCHQATSFKESTDNIQEHFNSPDELFGRPQVIKLLFKCETQIVEWTVNPYDANSSKVAKKLENNRQYISILSIKLRSVRKPLGKKQKGKITKGLSSPGFNNDTTESEQEEGNDGEYEETYM